MIRPGFIQGNARALPLADRSVQCIVTSPPYWGLRDYGLAPEAWGGEASCEHDFGPTSFRHKGGPQGKSLERAGRDVSAQNAAQHVATGSVCQRCGAWQGVLGLEPTPEMFVEHMVEIAREWWRVLRDDGTLWMNLGDSYATGAGKVKDAPGGGAQGRAFRDKYWGKHGERGLEPMTQPNRMPIPGLKPKDLVGIPWMVAFALRADGWYLRQDIVWAKPNPMPESVRDRCTKGHEYVFLLTKRERYYVDMHAIREPVTSTGGASFGKQNHDSTGTGAQSRSLGDASERNHPLGRNTRSVWTISTESFPEAHFATFPTRLAAKCIRAGTSEKGCCPHCGAVWERVVGRVSTGRPTKMPNGFATHAGAHGSVHRDGREKGAQSDEALSVTTGWRPTCDCVNTTGGALTPQPCTVLDPFGGAFTAPIVAAVLGRVGIGVEKKADYIQIGVRRWEHGRERVIARVIGKPRKPRRSPTKVRDAAHPIPKSPETINETLFPDEVAA